MLRYGLMLLASSGLLAATQAQAVTFSGKPTLVSPGVISSEFSEIRATVNPDGEWMLWGSTNRPGGPGGWNIWVSHRSAKGWSAPEPAPFNSEANDFDPAFAPDGRSLYFFSNRKGGLGGDDLYRVAFTDGKFGAAESLGAEVNSAGDEWAPALSPDGKTLLFATNGRGGAGRHDLFVSHATADGHWAKATALPGAINTSADEFDATFLEDGKTIVFTRSVNVEADEPVTLHLAAQGASGYEVGTPLPFTPDFQYSLGPAVSLRDHSLLFFSAAAKDAKSQRPDIYEVHYKLR